VEPNGNPTNPELTASPAFHDIRCKISSLSYVTDTSAAACKFRSALGSKIILPFSFISTGFCPSHYNTPLNPMLKGSTKLEARIKE